MDANVVTCVADERPPPLGPHVLLYLTRTQTSSCGNSVTARSVFSLVFQRHLQLTGRVSRAIFK